MSVDGIGASRRAFLFGAGALSVATASVGRAPDARATPLASATDLHYLCANDLAEALRTRRVSAIELVEAVIARIETLDAKINAVVVRDFDRARTAAHAADKAIARGETRPLTGVPVTVKESFDVAGLPTSWGDPRFRRVTPAQDALAVARLKQAGAIVIGKTNVPAWLADWQSDNDVYGRTNNPFDLCRTPGGSSGGSAAALAAGFGALSLGSDMGGSLRAPAHYCGVYAHKPTLGLVPRRGHAPPGSPAAPTEHELAVVGPMARSAVDLALTLDVLAGPDETRAGVGDKFALPAPRHDALRAFRILVVDSHPLGPTAAVVRDALADLAGRLAHAGAVVSDKRALAPDLARATRLHARMLAAYWGASLAPSAYRRLHRDAGAFSPRDRSLAAERARGAVASFRDWRAMQAQRAALQESWRAFFRDFDVVLCPAAPGPAFLHDRRTPIEARRLEIDGRRYSYLDAHTIWAAPATVAGLPATVAPMGRDPSGLPIGVQIVGPGLEDRTTLAFAQALERAFGGFSPPGRDALSRSCRAGGSNARPGPAGR